MLYKIVIIPKKNLIKIKLNIFLYNYKEIIFYINYA